MYQTVFFSKGYKPYTKINFRESSYFKGERSTPSLLKGTNVDAHKKCFYYKKQRHVIKNCKTRIVGKKGNKNLKQMLLPTQTSYMW